MPHFAIVQVVALCLQTAFKCSVVDIPKKLEPFVLVNQEVLQDTEVTNKLPI